MTTTDLYAEDLTDGRRASLHGHLFGKAGDLAHLVFDALCANAPGLERVGPINCAQWKAIVDGKVLADLVASSERKNGYTLTTEDGLTLDWVIPAHRYRVSFIEF